MNYKHFRKCLEKLQKFYQIVLQSANHNYDCRDYNYNMKGDLSWKDGMTKGYALKVLQ